MWRNQVTNLPVEIGYDAMVSLGPFFFAHQRYFNAEYLGRWVHFVSFVRMTFFYTFLLKLFGTFGNRISLE